jgi:hypothetical protein
VREWSPHNTSSADIGSEATSEGRWRASGDGSLGFGKKIGFQTILLKITDDAAYFNFSTFHFFNF